jgi:TonB family protein
MKKSKKPESFIQSPFYPGGNKAMIKFIHDELKYPPAAESKSIEGIVVVKISIDMNGKVFEAEVKKSIGYGCDEEAVRLVKLLKFQGVKLRNMKATFHKNININFNLRDKKMQVGEVKYNFVEKKSPSTEEKKPSSPKETFTIKIKLN